MGISHALRLRQRPETQGSTNAQQRPTQNPMHLQATRSTIIASDSSEEDSVVEFGNTIVFNTVDSSADEDSGLADMVGGPGLGYHDDSSAISRPSQPSAPEALYPAIDLRDRTTSIGMARRQDTLSTELGSLK